MRKFFHLARPPRLLPIFTAVILRFELLCPFPISGLLGFPHDSYINVATAISRASFSGLITVYYADLDSRLIGSEGMWDVPSTRIDEMIIRLPANTAVIVVEKKGIFTRLHEEGLGLRCGLVTSDGWPILRVFAWVTSAPDNGRTVACRVSDAYIACFPV